MKTVYATCRACGKTSPCVEKDMAEQRITMPDSHELIVTSWGCPECGFVHNVQLDDDRSKGIFNQLLLRMARFRRSVSMGKNPPPSEMNAMDALEGELNNARAALNARYDGSIYQCGELKLKLELCPPDAEISGEKESNNA